MTLTGGTLSPITLFSPIFSGADFAPYKNQDVLQQRRSKNVIQNIAYYTVNPHK